MEYGQEVDFDYDDIESVISLESEDPLDHLDRLQVVEEQVLDQADAQEGKELNPMEKDAGEGGGEGDGSQPAVSIINLEAHQPDSAFEHAGVAHLVHGWIQQNQPCKVCILCFDIWFLLILPRACTSLEIYAKRVLPIPR